MEFTTKLDYSNGRQIKQFKETFTNLSGGTTFGVPFSALTSGHNPDDFTDIETIVGGLSTFTGTTGTTTFDWFDDRMALAYSEIETITTLNSGITQDIGPVFTGNDFTLIDGNTVYDNYSGISYSVTVNEMVDLGSGNFSGNTLHNSIVIYSASSLDYSGRMIWSDNPGISRTDKLIISSNPQIGYYLKCINSEGLASWEPVSGGTDNSVWSASTGSNSIAAKNHNVDVTGVRSVAFGDNVINSGNNSLSFGENILCSAPGAYVGGRCSFSDSIIEGNGNTSFTHFYNTDSSVTYKNRGQASVILGGENGQISGSTFNSGIFCGVGNIVDSGISNSVVIAGSGITVDSSNTVYVPDLIIDGLTSVTDIQTDADGRIIDGASDISLKRNIKTLESSLDKVRALRGVSFNWKKSANMGNGIAYGLIAQEVKEVIPKMVKKRVKGSGKLTLDYKSLIPFIIESIKELSDPTYVPVFINKEIINSRDNTIVLNFEGTKASSEFSGIVVNKGVSENVDAKFVLNKNGDWVTNNYILPMGMVLPNYKPKSSDEVDGVVGEMTYDDDYIYVKTSSGWKRSNLTEF